MRSLALLAALPLLAVACGAATPEPPAPTTIPPTTAPATSVPNVADLPTFPPPAATPEVAPTRLPTAGPTPVDLNRFADMPKNVANGLPAPDFSARVLGDWSVTLSSQRGSYVLVIPTVVGCGDCVFTMDQLGRAYPEFNGRGIKVIVLNLFPQDVPESWGIFADIYGGMDFMWAVVDTDDFIINYDIQSLGTVLLINPEGALVYRSENSLYDDEFQTLFQLALQEG